jgi:hypothetical protein
LGVAADSLAGPVVDGADSTIATRRRRFITNDERQDETGEDGGDSDANQQLAPSVSPCASLPHALPRVGWRDCLWTDCGTNYYKVATDHCIVATIRQGPDGKSAPAN